MDPHSCLLLLKVGGNDYVFRNLIDPCVMLYHVPFLYKVENYE